MSRSHFIPFHFHFHHWDVNILEFYVFQTLLNISLSIITLFVPIYLISDLGYSIQAVLLFYLLYEIGFIFFVPFSGKAVHFLGVKKTIALQLPFLALYYIVLQNLSGNFAADLWLLVPVLLVRAFFRSNANVGVDVFMAKHVLKKKAGKMLAWLRILMIISTIISPLVGGLITYYYGFDSLFWFAIGLCILSGIPLLLTPDEHFDIKYKPQELFSFLTHKVDKHYIVSEAGNILPDTLMWIMWPLFLFFAIKNTVNMGLLVSASALVSIGVAFYIGKKIANTKPEGLIRNGVRASSVFFFLRAVSINPVFIAFIDACNKIVEPIFRIPYQRKAYRLVMYHRDQIKMANVRQLIRELYYTVGIILLLLYVVAVPEMTPMAFVLLFVFFSFIHLLMQYINSVKLTKIDKKIIKEQEKEGLFEEELEVLEEEMGN